MSTSSGQHLTTSRIQRIFRSLRAKCAALASHAPATTKIRPNVKATYSHTYKKLAARVSAEVDLLPLTVLPPPGSLGSRIHLDKASIENYELSKKIYDVRDAFRNIVQLAMGQPSSVHTSRSSAIMSLAGMCAAIVGDHIQHDIGVYEEDDDAAEDEEDIGSRVMDELYESVPAHYRSYTVIAHALSLVLDTCPHHPTLLHALLDVGVAFGLQRESQRLVHALLVAAVRPEGSSSCPLAHRAHTTYLVDLLDFVSSAGKVVSVPMFTTTLVDVLSHADSRAADAWSSTAVSRLARHMKRTHFGHSFVLLCSGLMDVYFHLTGHQSKKRKLSGTSSDDVQARLEPVLAMWMKWVLEHRSSHFLQCKSTGDDPVAAAADYRAVVETLTRAHLHQSHLLRKKAIPSTEPNIIDVLICVVTCCLASPLFTNLSSSERDQAQQLLSQMRPRMESYDTLIDLVSSQDSSTPLDDYSSFPPRDPVTAHSECRTTLYRLADTLRSQKLFLLEASLWSSALRHVEPLFDSWSALPRQDLTRWKAELVENVERAEAHCFGSREGNAVSDTSMQSAARGEWRWEEMVGCWVQATPKPPAVQGPVKRRKIDGRKPFVDGEHHHRLSEPIQSRTLLSLSTRLARDPMPSISVARTTSSTAADDGDMSSKVRGSLSMRALPEGRRVSQPSKPHPTTEDENDDPLSSFALKPLEKPARRLTNFSSILADAQANRTVLHPRSNLSTPLPQADPPVFKTPVRRVQSVAIEDESPARDPYSVATCLSSDDALNLFAYSSSPLVCRRR